HLTYSSVQTAHLYRYQKQWIQKSYSSLSKAFTLLSNISVLMKHQLGVSSKLHPVTLVQRLDSVKNSLQSIFPYRKIEIINNIPPTVSILADSLFDHLLLNLFTNAVKNDPHMVVKIEIGMELRPDQSNCILTVMDYAEGIPPHQREGLFERFTEFRKKGKGSGLGLFIVKTLVERYGGQIWIENRIPDDYTQGSCFKMKLQLA
ncbi:MAG: sensor histidine kinase, partial [Candidatus Hodarchaeota archaeon]